MRRRWARLELITIVLLVSAAKALAASGSGPADAKDVHKVQPPARNAKPDENAKPAPAPALVSTSAMNATDYSACVAGLAADRIVFEELATAKDQGCELSGAIRLAAAPTAFGDVSFAGKPVMLCSFGRQFAGWVREVAAPLTLGYTGQRLAEVETGSAFSCRSRYDKPGLVPSEHAKGDAVDIAAFVLADHRRIAVKEADAASSSSSGLVHALRMTACGYFATVLGPGSDAAHAEHLHFDSGLHGSTPNYRICE